MSLFANKQKKPDAPSAGAPTPAPPPAKKAVEAGPKKQEPAGGRRSATPARSARPSANSSTLNPHLNFEGTLNYTGTVTVDCEFRGSIVSDDTIVVGPNGTVTAELTAAVVEVSGKVHGNIKATKSARIRSGAEVYGNIETPTICMEEGVVFEGSCSRMADADNAPAAAHGSRGHESVGHKHARSEKFHPSKPETAGTDHKNTP